MWQVCLTWQNAVKVHPHCCVNQYLNLFFFKSQKYQLVFSSNVEGHFVYFSLNFLAITNKAAIKIQVQSFVLIKVSFCLSKHVRFHLLNYMVNIYLIFKVKKPSKVSSKVAVSYYTSKSNE